MDSDQGERIRTQPLQRIFTNPICQKTFVALPRIYGLKELPIRRRIKPAKNQSLKECKQSLIKHVPLVPETRKSYQKNLSVEQSLSNLRKRTNYSFTNLESLSNTKNATYGTKHKHFMMEKLNKFSSLTDLETDHKIVSTRGIVLLPISHNSEELPFQTLSGELFDKKIKQSKKMISPINEAVDEERSATPDSTNPLRKNDNHYYSQPNKIKATALKNVNDHISPFRSSELRSSLSRQDTYFKSFINMENNRGVSYSPSHRSVSSVGSYCIPTKDQIESFIENYKPVNSEFDLKKITKSPDFQIVSYKKGLYIGQYVNKQRHGMGLFITQKYMFEGLFKNGFKSSGSETNNEGVYTGEMVNGLREGQGVFKWKNGEVYEGNWKQGQKSGKGVWRSESDSYDGEWSHNRQQGFGIHRHTNSVYQGYFKNFLKHGKGKQLFTSGDFYQGQYFEGKPSGFGKYIWKNGDRYQGEFVNGLRHGKGIIWESGDCYSGQFSKDFKDGIGQIVYQDGRKWKGEFKNDQPLDFDD